ncbi:hypothetical protein FA10DRAFT_219811, partial [Acaromyces ingoldii]
MNGIKKVFSHRSSQDGSESSSSPTSPQSQQSNLSSTGRTSVDSQERAPNSKSTAGGLGLTSESGAKSTTTGGNTTNMNGAAAGSKVGTGLGRSADVSTADGSMRHSHGHNLGTTDLSKGKVTQTVEHLGEKTSRTHHTHNIEEVERQRELERHQHHIQVHHQPIAHETHEAEKLHNKAHPVTNIYEKHASTDKDAKLLSTVAHSHGHKDELKHAPVIHQIVDRGEKVNETVHHHIHNVVVPLVNHESHEHHRIKTTIPTSHVVHEAPIIHESARLEPLSKEEYLKRGGILGSKKTDVGEANLLHSGTCERKVDGVAEKLAEEL